MEDLEIWKREYNIRRGKWPVVLECFKIEPSLPLGVASRIFSFRLTCLTNPADDSNGSGKANPIRQKR
jgi:hypothetical protein